MRRAILLGVLAMAACGGNDDHAANIKGDTSEGGARAAGGKSNKAGAAGAAGRATGGSAGTSTTVTSTAGAAGTPTVNPAAPIVTIISPTGTTDPNDATKVITADFVDVSCKAEAAAVPGATVNVATTKLYVPGSDAEDRLEPSKVTTTDNVTIAQFTTVGLPTGKVTFMCEAMDRSSLALTGTAEPLVTFIDHGPTVTILEPKDNAPWSQKEPVKVTFTVTPNKLTDADTLAGTESVQLTINDKVIPVAETVAGSGTYSATVGLTDTQYFAASETPNGATTIRARAVNQRKADADTSIKINVDSTPPVITVVKPTQPAIIGGQQQAIIFTVTDPVTAGTTQPGSGTDPTKVVVKLNSTEFAYDATSSRWSFVAASNTFSFNFREGDLSASATQATIVIRAADIAGNQAAPTTFPIYLDARPPLVLLDAPTMREMYTDASGTRCSNAFDPLGEAINDLAISDGAATFRAFVWDETNSPLNPATAYYAGVNESTVTLFLQDELSHPLLTDKDGDGICDDIDEGQTGWEPYPLQLKPLTPAGTSPRMYNSTTKSAPDDTRYWPAPDYSGATPPETPATAPDFLCGKSSDMVRVTRHAVIGTDVPVIYAYQPTPPVDCTGMYWEFKGAVNRTERDGWLCLAARAADTLGNVGISPVMSICYDDPATPTVPSCATVKLPEPAESTKPPWMLAGKWGSLPRSSEPSPCKVTCKMPTITPVRFNYLPN